MFANDKIYVPRMIIFQNKKTLWEKEKMLVTSIFSVFQQGFQKGSSWGSLKIRNGYQHLFPPFLTMFCKGFFVKVVKTQVCFAKG